LAEAGIMMQLKPHPHVIQLIGVAIGGSSIYMVLEFVNGGSLEAALRKGRTFQDEELRELLVQICRGLQHLHSNNLVHRDLAGACGRIFFIIHSIVLTLSPISS